VNSQAGSLLSKPFSTDSPRSAYDLSERGFHVDSIIYPAVKRGEARLRFNMNAHHTHSQIDELVDSLGNYR
jgi:7-keto-8-aminopelargonate synthetase-like enzyme